MRSADLKGTEITMVRVIKNGTIITHDLTQKPDIVVNLMLSTIVKKSLIRVIFTKISQNKTCEL